MSDNPETEQGILQPGQPDLRQSFLGRLSSYVAGETDLSELMQGSIRIVFESLPCAFCRILILEPETDAFVVAAVAGGREPLKSEIERFSRGGTLANQALAASGPLLVNAGGNQPGWPSSISPDEANRGVWLIPLKGHEQPIGVLEIYFQPQHSIGPEDVQQIQIAANLLSTAIDRSRVNQEFKKLDLELDDAIAQRTEWIQLLSETTIAANEADSVAEAMQTVLTKVCLYTHWPVGHVYVPAKGGPPGLRPTPVWFTRDPERYQPFIQATQNTHFPPGASLPGKVFETGKPLWVIDISRKEFLRASEAEQTGLKAAFAFPVLIQKEVAAVMEFFTEQAIPPDQQLLDVVANIGIQVGRVIERRRAQEVLENSQRQLAEAHRIARLGTWEWNMLTGQINWSDRLFEIYGLNPDFFPGSYDAYLAMLHPDDRTRIAEMIEQAKAHPGPFEYQHRIVRPDGETRVIQARGDVITDSNGVPIRMYGTGQDITRRAQMEDELRTHQELLHNVITAAPIILWAVDRQRKITLIEGMGTTLMGDDPQSLMGQSISDLAGDNPDVLEYIQRAMEGEQVVAEMETEDSVYETRFAPMLNTHNEIVGVMGISLDITSRVQAELARRASDARFRVIFEGSAIGMGIIDLDHQILVTNPVLQHMLELTAEEIQQNRVEQLIHPRDRAKIKTQIENLLAGDATLFHQEVRFLRKERSSIWASLSASLVLNPNGTPNFAILMLEDITSHKQMEAELIEIQQQLVASREQERLHLAQEIHDDPLQNLYGLMYQLDSVLEEVDSEQGLAEIQEMKASINRIINTLRGICRGLRPPTLMPFGLEVSIREHIDGFKKEHPDIKLHLDLMYDGQSLSEHIRLTLFRIYQQAISNVARHARASNVTVQFRFDNQQAGLVVSDDGKGFQVPDRWVELVRKNHMGLAGSAERVEILNGRFEVTSSPENGTRIEAVIPRSHPGFEEDLDADVPGGTKNENQNLKLEQELNR